MFNSQALIGVFNQFPYRSMFGFDTGSQSRSLCAPIHAAPGKATRITVTLECTTCRNGSSKVSRGVSRYTTQKNRLNTPDRLELKKFCPYCNKHTVHGEIKK